MKLERTKRQELPDHVIETVEQLLGKIDTTWEVVLVKEDQKNFGVSPRDGELVVTLANCRAAKNTRFETDGTWQDGITVPGADGYSRRRHVEGWSYVLLVNLVSGVDKAKDVNTCYVNDPLVYATLRGRLGHRA